MSEKPRSGLAKAQNTVRQMGYVMIGSEALERLAHFLALVEMAAERMTAEDAKQLRQAVADVEPAFHHLQALVLGPQPANPRGTDVGPGRSS